MIQYTRSWHGQLGGKDILEQLGKFDYGLVLDGNKELLIFKVWYYFEPVGKIFLDNTVLNLH